MEENQKKVLLDNKWFQFFVGATVIAALTLAIVLPLTMGGNSDSNSNNDNADNGGDNGGDNGEERPPLFDGGILDEIEISLLTGNYKKTFEDEVDAWGIMTTTTEGLVENKWTWNSSVDQPTNASSFVIDNLSKNTMYFSWYTNKYYHYDQEFKDFKKNGYETLTNSIYDCLQVINNAPVLEDFVTVEEYQQWTQDLNTFLNSLTVQYDEWLTVAMNLYNEFVASKFGENFGIMGVSYFETESGVIQIEAWYKGTALVTQDQITNTTDTLPSIYQFKWGLLDTIEQYYLTLYEYKYEVYNNAFDEATFNTLTGVSMTYSEYLSTVQELGVIIDEFGVTDIWNMTTEFLYWIFVQN